MATAVISRFPISSFFLFIFVFLAALLSFTTFPTVLLGWVGSAIGWMSALDAIQYEKSDTITRRYGGPSGLSSSIWRRHEIRSKKGREIKEIGPKLESEAWRWGNVSSQPFCTACTVTRTCFDQRVGFSLHCLLLLLLLFLFLLSKCFYLFRFRYKRFWG